MYISERGPLPNKNKEKVPSPETPGSEAEKREIPGSTRHYSKELVIAEEQKLEQDKAKGILTPEQIVERELKIARLRQNIEKANQ